MTDRKSNTVALVVVGIAVLLCVCLCGAGVFLIFGASAFTIAGDTATAGRDGLEYGSASDVEAILRDHGASPGSLACRNLYLGGELTRGVSCVTRLSSADVAGLTSSMGLSRESSSPPSPMESGGCATRPDFSATTTGVEVWVVHGRPATAPGMEYFAVYTNTVTGEACVQTQYAWS